MGRAFEYRKATKLKILPWEERLNIEKLPS